MASQNRIQFCLNTPSISTFGSALYEENGDFANGYWISPNRKIYTALDSVVIGNHTYYACHFLIMQNQKTQEQAITTKLMACCR